MQHYETELQRTAARLRDEGVSEVGAVVVSGSGLAVDLGEPAAGPFPLHELLPFAIENVEGHPLSCEFLAPQNGRPGVLYFRGRLHVYQGHTAAEVVFPVRFAALLGARVALLSNASGGIRSGLAPGQLLLLRDQINLTGRNPLCGTPNPSWGPRFPSMNRAFDPELRSLAQEVARELEFELEEGVYAGLLGPSYETPAEVEMIRRCGGDLVGMSTVLEVIAARHLGLRCLGISLVSNLAAGTVDEEPTHDEVLEAGRQAADRFRRLLRGILARLDLERGP